MFILSSRSRIGFRCSCYGLLWDTQYRIHQVLIYSVKLLWVCYYLKNSCCFHILDSTFTDVRKPKDQGIYNFDDLNLLKISVATLNLSFDLSSIFCIFQNWKVACQEKGMYYVAFGPTLPIAADLFGLFSNHPCSRFHCITEPETRSKITWFCYWRGLQLNLWFANDVYDSFERNSVFTFTESNSRVEIQWFISAGRFFGEILRT